MAATKALSYRSELIPTWSATLAVEVLRASLGDVESARQRVLNLPPPTRASNHGVGHHRSMARSFHSVAATEKTVDQLQATLLKRPEFQDALLAVLTNLNRGKESVSPFMASFVKTISQSESFHPLVRAEALLHYMRRKPGNLTSTRHQFMLRSDSPFNEIQFQSTRKNPHSGSSFQLCREYVGRGPATD